MRILRKMNILLLSLAFCLTNLSLAIGFTISKTGGSHLTPVFVDNPGSHPSDIKIADLPSGARITNVRADYSYYHCPYDHVKLTLTKQKGDAAPLPLVLKEDGLAEYVARNYTTNESTLFANSDPNDVWLINMEIKSNACYSDPNCNPNYHGHEGYFYEWTLTITYEIQPVTIAPSLVSPNKRYFTGSTLTTNVGFSWGSVPNATSYQLDIFDGHHLLQAFSPQATSLNISSLQPLRRYLWAVAGANALGTGPFSEVRKFIIGPTAECWPELGYSGNGYVETCYDLSSSTDKYLLKDISRRANMNVVDPDGVVGHNGNMSNTASIITQKYNVTEPMTDLDNNWTESLQKSGVDAHVNAGKVYDYLWSTLDLSSPDGQRNSMINIVESTDPRGCPNNAFFDPAPSVPTVHYCAGTTYSSSLDIVGHEWGHAVTRLASSRGGLDYSGESGALNEAFSDWIGTAIKQAYGDYSWVIIMGDDIRSLSDPANGSLNPQQPDTYGRGPNWVDTYNCFPTEDNDFCGVHYNSGVPNKMFFLLSNPGVNVHNNISTVGIGIENAIKIAYLANMEYWEANATFVQARDGMINAAEYLHGAASWEAAQVENAWNAVGVTSTSTPASLMVKKLMPILSNLLLLE